MFSWLRGGEGYQPLNNSDTDSQSGSDSGSVNSMDLNGDGEVTAGEIRQYVELKFHQKVRQVVNDTSGSTSACITGVIFGGAMVVAGQYGETMLGEDTAKNMKVAGMAMLGSGIAGFLGKGIKFVTGKDYKPDTPPRNDITRLV